jgi:hypothetical protein
MPWLVSTFQEREATKVVKRCLKSSLKFCPTKMGRLTKLQNYTDLQVSTKAVQSSNYLDLRGIAEPLEGLRERKRHAFGSASTLMRLNAGLASFACSFVKVCTVLHKAVLASLWRLVR